MVMATEGIPAGALVGVKAGAVGLHAISLLVAEDRSLDNRKSSIDVTQGA
jgi:hypothetical protein